MHCVFVVQASGKIGVGHLMRCLALAQALSASSHKVTFLLDKQSQEIAVSINEWCGEIIPIDYHAAVDVQITHLKTQRLIAVDWLIIDGYQFDYNYCQSWQGAGYKLALFDDGVHRIQYAADIIVNASSTEEKTINEVPVLAGSQYRLLRKEFVGVGQHAIVNRKYLTIAFGGSDPADVTRALLVKLSVLAFDAPIRVITGQAYPFLDDLKNILAQSSLNIEHIHAAQDMASIWSSSKLAISAAGGSQFELAVCATPSILVVVADNQLQASSIASQEGWCFVADFTAHSQRKESLEKLCSMIKSLWSNETQLTAMQRAIEGKYDAGGAQRIVEALKAYG